MLAGAKALSDGFINGIDMIFLDNVECNGSENTLLNCKARPFRSHDCIHAEDAGVSCPGMFKARFHYVGGQLGQQVK